MQTKYDEVRVASLQPTVTARKFFGTRPENRTNTADDVEHDRAQQENVASVGRDKNIANELKRFKERIDSPL